MKKAIRRNSYNKKKETNLSLKSPKPTVEIVVVAKYHESKNDRFSKVEMIAAGMSVVKE